MVKRYNKTTIAEIKKGTAEYSESPEELRKDFPKDLIDAFVAVHNSHYEDAKLYKKYERLVKKFLGEKIAEDPIESGRLTVRLTKATFDLVNNEKATKNKDKKLVGDRCSLSQKGTNEGP